MKVVFEKLHGDFSKTTKNDFPSAAAEPPLTGSKEILEAFPVCRQAGAPKPPVTLNNHYGNFTLNCNCGCRFGAVTQFSTSKLRLKRGSCSRVFT